MRILQISNKPPYPPRDGGSLAMFSLANALNKQGHKITVLTMFTKKHKFTLEQHQAYKKIMDVHSVYVDAGIYRTGLLSNYLFSDQPYTATRFSSVHFEQELVKLLKSSAFDVIQLEGLYLTHYIPAIRSHSSAVIALRAHNVEHEIWERIASKEKLFFRKKYFSLVARRLKNYETKAMNSYDLLVPITDRDNEKFNELGNIRPVHVCPAGVDIRYAPPGKESEEQSQGFYNTFNLYYLGSLDWIPNQEGLLWFISKVFPGLRQKYPDLKLHVAGRNAQPDLIEKLDTPGVVYYGEINDPTEFSQNHTAMIAPCFSGSGMRMKIIEAMAHGKPVITSSIGAEGLIAVNGEHIMIADDPVAFAGSVERLINNPELCHSMGRNAYKLVYDRYNIADIAAGLAEFYKQNLK